MSTPLKAFLYLALCVSCGDASAPTTPFRAHRTTPIALVGASVLTMATDTLLQDQTILIREGRIEALGPAATVAVPSDARVIALRGKFVMPGLVDMHVHRAIRDAALYVPSGITTVRNMWGYSGLQEFAASIDALPYDAPTILAVSPGIDGHPATWPGTRFLESPAKVRDSLAVLAAEGWMAFKIYDHVPALAFDSILAIAHERGMAVVGHVPLGVSVSHALTAGMHEIEHLTGYDHALGTAGHVGLRNWSAVDATRFTPLVQSTVRAQTWNCATLAIISEMFRLYWPNERAAAVRNRRAFVKALFDGGARLLIGTDSGTDIVVPAGSTIVEEIEEHVQAGIPTYAVLRAATANAAESLGQESVFGSVVVGLRADLLVLDANPVVDRRTLRAPHAVVLRGSWIGYR
jgi:imidazolonepropionase-like amidohydrolase